MNKGIIDETLINKDIEFIDYYSEEETDCLRKLNSLFEDVEKNYSSDNTSLFLQSLENSESDILKFNEKRAKYILVLQKAIMKYKDAVENSKNIFKESDK